MTGNFSGVGRWGGDDREPGAAAWMTHQHHLLQPGDAQMSTRRMERRLEERERGRRERWLTVWGQRGERVGKWLERG